MIGNSTVQCGYARAGVCAAVLGLHIAGCAMPGPDNGAVHGRTTRTTSELSQAQSHFSRGEFGLAEKNFRKAVESDAQNPEAWLGLAAAYDQLARFDMADRSYKRAKDLLGETSVLLNNRGYSYMLRGDLVRAKRLLVRARRMDPANQRIARNIEELNVRLERAGRRPIAL